MRQSRKHPFNIQMRKNINNEFFITFATTSLQNCNSQGAHALLVCFSEQQCVPKLRALTLRSLQNVQYTVDPNNSDVQKCVLMNN